VRRHREVWPTSRARPVPGVGAAGRVAPGNPRGTAPPSEGEGRGSPLPPRGEEGGRRPKGPAGPQAVESPGLRDALIPKGPPLSPPPTSGGFRRYGGPPSRRCAFVQGWRSYNQRPRTGQVRRRAHSRRAPGKGTPPHGPWGGVGAWGSPVQGEVRMVPYIPHRHEEAVPVGHVVEGVGLSSLSCPLRPAHPVRGGEDGAGMCPPPRRGRSRRSRRGWRCSVPRGLPRPAHPVPRGEDGAVPSTPTATKRPFP
jgi:hypothetical protein